jgi:uncharacterized YigZ family protein
MSSRYPIVAQESSTEMVVVNSRFVCTLGMARSVEAAMNFVRAAKLLHAGASSHAYAYHIGFGASVTDGCNDGGEPSGTAGRPMLAILQGSGLGDAVAVVSRYFGGTKLGTGGLVRAFGGALKAALEQSPRRERIERSQFSLTAAYPLYERLGRLLAGFDCQILETTFDEAVHWTLSLADDDCARCGQAIADLTAGAAQLEPAAKLT